MLIPEIVCESMKEINLSKNIEIKKIEFELNQLLKIIDLKKETTKKINFIEKMIIRAREIIILVNTLKSTDINFLSDYKTNTFIKENEGIFNDYGSPITFLNFIQILFNQDLINETIIRGLGNNQYFFDEIEKNYNAIYTILSFPDQYVFNITKIELDNIKKCLSNKIKICKVPRIIHMIITMTVIYCALNSEIFYSRLLDFSNQQLTESESIIFKNKIYNFIESYELKPQLNYNYINNQEYNDWLINYNYEINLQAIENIKEYNEWLKNLDY